MAELRLRSMKKPVQAKEIKTRNGVYKQGEELRPSILMYHTQIKALVQGCDFEINEAGEIKRLR